MAMHFISPLPTCACVAPKAHLILLITGAGIADGIVVYSTTKSNEHSPRHLRQAGRVVSALLIIIISSSGTR